MKVMGVIVAVALSWSGVAFGGLIVPSDGSDGALHVAANTVIDLSQAVTGSWDANNAANAGKGIYDPGKWAVVFKYSSVTIEAGATVTFSNHPSRAPVVWLVSGDVVINGTLSLNGQHSVGTPMLAEPGPGGFRGGMGYFSGLFMSGAGFGPGGGIRSTSQGYGGLYESSYGNASLIPLIGGSGGAGGGQWNQYVSQHSGGGGGGAILLATSDTLTINGMISADGGSGHATHSSDLRPKSGGGSGGAIRLVANSIIGSGTVGATGGGGGHSGNQGKVRMEWVSASGEIIALPSPSVVELAENTAPLIWLPESGPTVQIVSIGGYAAPTDPRADIEIGSPDIHLPQTNSTQVVIETVNAEAVSTVRVRATPRGNANFTTVNASLDEVISADPLTIRWVADVPVNAGSSVFQVHVVRP